MSSAPARNPHRGALRSMGSCRRVVDLGVPQRPCVEPKGCGPACGHAASAVSSNRDNGVSASFGRP